MGVVSAPLCLAASTETNGRVDCGVMTLEAFPAESNLW